MRAPSTVSLAPPGRLGQILLMAKLYFNYSTMNAGKSTLLLQASYNYIERGMQTYLLTANFDDRAGKGQIGSRIGISAEADTYTQTDDLFAKIAARLAEGPCACVLVDEAQWMTKDQVWQLARAVDDLGVPIMCYGLRVDFQGELFPRLGGAPGAGRRNARGPHDLPLRKEGHDGDPRGRGRQGPARGGPDRGRRQ